MKTDPQQLLVRSLGGILLAGALLYILAFIAVAYMRISYPFELEWMEGGMLDHVRRILEGQKLYVRPSLDFIPYLYPPLYFYLSAAFSAISVEGFVALRLVSFLSSIGCFFIIYCFVYRETESRYAGLLSASLFAATYRLSGAWFDIGRIDPLFLLFLLAAIYFLRFASSNSSYLIAGVFISLSFLTKQTALLVALPVMLYCLLSVRRPSLVFILSAILISGGSAFILDRIHDGWYNYYLFELPRQHAIVKGMLINYWIYDILKPLSIVVVMALYYLYRLFRGPDKKRLLFYIFFGAGMIGASWAGRLHVGGSENVLLPAYAFLAIIFGLAFSDLKKASCVNSQGRKNILLLLLYMACILQFIAGPLRYNPLAQVPSDEDLQAGRELVSMLSEKEGDIFIPDHSYLVTLAGKKGHAHAMAINDILKSQNGEIKERLAYEIDEALRQRRYSAVILDSFLPFKKENVELSYEYSTGLFNDKKLFIPVTGITKRPERLYIPMKANKDEQNK